MSKPRIGALYGIPASRTTDPNTSKKAEAQMNLGSRQKRARQVLELVNRFPNRTSGELSHSWYQKNWIPVMDIEEWMRWDVGIRIAAETPHKRLPELEDMGLVERNQVPRKCTDSGQLCHTWSITERGKRELSNES